MHVTSNTIFIRDDMEFVKFMHWYIWCIDEVSRNVHRRFGKRRWTIYLTEMRVL